MKDDSNKVDFVRRDLKAESIIKTEDDKKSRFEISSVFDPSIITECPRRIMFKFINNDKTLNFVNLRTPLRVYKMCGWRDSNPHASRR